MLKKVLKLKFYTSKGGMGIFFLEKYTLSFCSPDFITPTLKKSFARCKNLNLQYKIQNTKSNPDLSNLIIRNYLLKYFFCDIISIGNPFLVVYLYIICLSVCLFNAN